jgi:hypothetical protein
VFPFVRRAIPRWRSSRRLGIFQPVEWVDLFESELAKTVENVLLTLSTILSSARKWGYKVPEVTLSDLSLPRKVKTRPRCYSADDMVRIIASADEPLYPSTDDEEPIFRSTVAKMP